MTSLSDTTPLLWLLPFVALVGIILLIGRIVDRISKRDDR